MNNFIKQVIENHGYKSYGKVIEFLENSNEFIAECNNWTD